MLQAELPPAGPGGVGRQVDLLATALVRKGHTVTVFTTGAIPSGAEYQCERVVLRHDGRLYRQFGTGWAFAHLDLTGFDVVHAHGDDWLMGRTPRVRTFYGTALMEARYATSWLRRGSQLCYYALELLSSVQCHGVTISRRTQRYLPLARECIPCAYDPSIFFPGGVRTTEPSILFVAGTLAGRKRGPLLLLAFNEVRGAFPNARLTIVSRDGVEAEGVTCVDEVSPRSLGDLYRSHWLLCSTSSYEGFGVPYIEAMAAGLPIVATANTGAEEVLDGGRNGVICSPEYLGATLVKVLADRIRRERLTLLGVKASHAYSLRSVVTAYEGLYAQVSREPEPSE